jgi:integrase/recombinase XerD
LKAYRSHLVHRDYLPATISPYLSGIRRLFEAMMEWGWRDDDPTDDLRARKDLTSRSEKIVSKYIPDRSAFLDLYMIPDQHTSKGKRDRAILRIFCYTGIRVSELCALNLNDIHLSKPPTLTVRAGKGNKCRHTPLGEADARVLRREIEGDDPQALMVALDHRHFGARLSTRGARNIVDQYLRVAGLKNPWRSYHALRHSTTTWQLKTGVPKQAIAELPSHAAVDRTAIYARVADHRKCIPGDVLSKRIREVLHT